MYVFYADCFIDAFEIWLCEVVDKSTNTIKPIKCIYTFNDLRSKIKEHIGIKANDTFASDSNRVFDWYGDALDYAKQQILRVYTVNEKLQLEQAEYHLKEYLRLLNNISTINDGVRQIFNEYADMKWNTSWATPVYRYCIIGNNELCLITENAETMTGSEWEDDVLKWTYLGTTHYYYRTKELALETFKKENNIHG